MILLGLMASAPSPTREPMGGQVPEITACFLMATTLKCCLISPDVEKSMLLALTRLLGGAHAVPSLGRDFWALCGHLHLPGLCAESPTLSPRRDEGRGLGTC